MHVDIKDVKNLIVFAAKEKNKVQTHNGKRTFTCRYELVSEKEDNDNVHRDTCVTPDVMSMTPADKNTSAATQAPISSVSTPHIVGTLTIRNIELVVDEKENMTAIVNGNLNKRFRVSYLLLEYEKINELLAELENDKKETRIKTCFVKDSEDEISLVFPNKFGGAEKAFNVSFVKRNSRTACPEYSRHTTKNRRPVQWYFIERNENVH